MILYSRATHNCLGQTTALDPLLSTHPPTKHVRCSCATTIHKCWHAADVARGMHLARTFSQSDMHCTADLSRVTHIIPNSTQLGRANIKTQLGFRNLILPSNKSKMPGIQRISATPPLHASKQSKPQRPQRVGYLARHSGPVILIMSVTDSVILIMSVTDSVILIMSVTDSSTKAPERRHPQHMP